MNIFFLDLCPIKAARMLYDKHIVKMGLESVQLLQTAQIPTPKTVIRWYTHPCARWVRASSDNFEWLKSHARAIFKEYTYRYGKIHEWAEKVKTLSFPSGRIESLIKVPTGTLTMPALAMPTELHVAAFDSASTPLGRAVTAYRLYYKYKIEVLHYDMKWTKRSKPEWLS